MTHIEIIGYVATVLLGTAFIPQAVKIWQTKSVRDISLVTFTLVNSANVLWLYYSFARSDWPLFTATVLLTCTQGSILLCKIFYAPKSDKTN